MAISDKQIKAINKFLYDMNTKNVKEIAKEYGWKTAKGLKRINKQFEKTQEIKNGK